MFEDVLDDFPVDKSLNAAKDTLEKVYPLVKDTSDDFYVDKLLNVLGDAFEKLYTIIKDASEDLYVGKLLDAFRDVLENIYVTNEFVIFENISFIDLLVVFRKSSCYYLNSSKCLGNIYIII